MASWILDEFDPLSNGSRGEQVGGSGLDELQILAQDASGTGFNSERERTTAQQPKRILPDIPFDGAPPTHTSGSPPRRLSMRMSPPTSPSLVSLSPADSNLYHADSMSPPYTVRKQLSASLFDSLPSSSPKTASTRLRPALANLFSSSSSLPSLPGEPSPQRHRSPAPPAAIHFSAVPGLNTILNADMADALRPSLPARLRIASQWTLLYSLDAHGISLNTLYNKVDAGMANRGMAAGLLLIVKDNEGGVFGAFINEKLRRTEGYYGSGECFLWKETRFPKDDVRLGTGVKVFTWTGRNNYVVQSDDDFISVGGGRDGKFGLWVDASFENGHTSRCLTFDNQPLCGPDAPRSVAGAGAGGGAAEPLHGQDQGRSFQVNRVEVWRIGQ